MNWVGFAIIDTLASSIKADVNRKYKIEHHILNTWRTLFACLLLIPVLFFIPAPQTLGFYLAAFAVGIEATCSSLLQFRLAAEFNGRIANLKEPVQAGLLFLGWLAIDSGYRAEMTSHPMRMGLILFLVFFILGLCTFMYRNALSALVFRRILPIALINVSVTLFVASSLEHKVEHITDMFWFYLCVMGFQFFISSCVLVKRRNYSLAHAMTIKWPIVLTGLTGLCGMFGWYAVLVAPNPSYPRIILLSSPILLGFFYNRRRIEDKASPILGTFFVLAVILLVWISAKFY